MYSPSLVPIPNVTVTAFNDRIFSDSLSLECIITTVKGIVVKIVWMANATILKRINDSSGNIVNNLEDIVKLGGLQPPSPLSAAYTCNHSLLATKSILYASCYRFLYASWN